VLAHQKLAIALILVSSRKMKLRYPALASPGTVIPYGTNTSPPAPNTVVPTTWNGPATRRHALDDTWAVASACVPGAKPEAAKRATEAKPTRRTTLRIDQNLDAKRNLMTAPAPSADARPGIPYLIAEERDQQCDTVGAAFRPAAFAA